MRLKRDCGFTIIIDKPEFIQTAVNRFDAAWIPDAARIRNLPDIMISISHSPARPRQCPECNKELSAPLETDGELACPDCGQVIPGARQPVTVLRLPESQMIDGEKWQKLQSELLAVIEKLNEPQILLDLRDVRLLSSTAFSGLLTLHRKIKSAQGRLALCRVQPQVTEVFRITRLHQIIEIFDDEDTGAAAFADN